MSETDDKEQRLKVDLMKADLALQKQQSIRETQRNIAILATAIAAIAGVLRFKLG